MNLAVFLSVFVAPSAALRACGSWQDRTPAIEAHGLARGVLAGADNHGDLAGEIASG
jgi:hypothetical protein